MTRTQWKLLLVLLFLGVICLAPRRSYSGPTPASARRLHERLPAAEPSIVVPPTNLAPVDGTTCFAPDQQCDVTLEGFVASAHQSVDMAIYDLNLDQLVHQLLVLKAKGIPVRVVVDKKQSKGQHSLVGTLVKAGINLRYGHQRGIMHNKFTIVDGKEIETGSFNYTNHATQANQENQVYLTSPTIVQAYQARFEKIWAGATTQ